MNKSHAASAPSPRPGPQDTHGALSRKILAGPSCGWRGGWPGGPGLPPGRGAGGGGAALTAAGGHGGGGSTRAESLMWGRGWPWSPSLVWHSARARSAPEEKTAVGPLLEQVSRVCVCSPGPSLDGEGASSRQGPACAHPRAPSTEHRAC